MLPAALRQQIQSQPLHGAEDREVRAAAQAFWRYIDECDRAAAAIRDAFAREVPSTVDPSLIPIAPDDDLQAQLAGLAAVVATIDGGEAR